MLAPFGIKPRQMKIEKKGSSGDTRGNSSRRPLTAMCPAFSRYPGTRLGHPALRRKRDRYHPRWGTGCDWPERQRNCGWYRGTASDQAIRFVLLLPLERSEERLPNYLPNDTDCYGIPESAVFPCAIFAFFQLDRREGPLCVAKKNPIRPHDDEEDINVCSS